jgi:hypothetical protein
VTQALRIEPEAEFVAAAAWYESKRPGLGFELVAVIDGAIDEILAAPDANPLWRPNHPYRRRRVPRFPYVVFYTTSETVVTVVAFAHAKREPGYWFGRSPAPTGGGGQGR